MKMGKIEKLFVNSPSRSKSVSRHAEKMLTFIHVQPGHKYLDVGCGNGAAAICLAQKYPLEVIGVDVDPEQIQAARERSRDIANVRFLVVDGTRLPFGDGEFDVVATNKVTHHIYSWEEALAEMLRVLKPNGYLIYEDLVFPVWLASLGKKATKSMGFPTRKALRALVEENRLTQTHLSKVFGHYEAVWQKVHPKED